jgi:NAD(P)-dependent dehydrogenase (short-subunit alcohol dehydrogenase family)
MTDNQVVLITGSSSGFGRLTAETLAKSGYCVYASLRDKNGKNKFKAKALETFAKESKLALHVIELDVLQTKSVNKAVETVIKEQGRIDVLVNNAGSLHTGITEAYTEEQAFDQMNTNFFSVVRANRAVLPHMRKQGSGLIIHVSSIIGRIVFPFFGHYCASKFALEALAESYRYELAPLGIDSVIVEPGAYATEIGAKIPAEKDKATVEVYRNVLTYRDKMSEAMGKLLAAEKPADPQEVADLIKQLIEMPVGSRPLRTTCGGDLAVSSLNESSQFVQSEALNKLGLADMQKVCSTVRG